MQIPCPDGFLLEPGDPLFEAHTRLSEYLIAEEQRLQLVPFDVGRWRKLPKRDLYDQTLSILTRIDGLQPFFLCSRPSAMDSTALRAASPGVGL